MQAFRQELILREGDRFVLDDGTELIVRRIRAGRVSLGVVEQREQAERHGWLHWPLRPALLRGR
ncbi:MULTISPECIES: hypothetical protein [Pseudomonas]|jgi:hypothetical protein|uniref:Uncharacterized protein n=1 Tax=Pseudomonas citronellolis TaxID=53408 RepID=A0A127MQH5_9PSED|nr:MULTISPECIES: hypothetical protein [Pseudomonas]KSW27032.1 hypothetical protein AOX63_25935 [Pseudomonas sp. ADP]AMO75509.1 hypothetical protein PcP3B5_20620 [Pseudomonas citronellolis]ANI14337.1 hypothetical protein A9C11_10225 [Pseudomonas citronellolis]KES25354.1 hypothetical protein FG99_04380 [Pseudomonas sp. AAC]KRV75765.1 hypothetical protein AO742_03170 [Pseudomonas citronellolis]